METTSRDSTEAVRSGETVLTGGFLVAAFSAALGAVTGGFLGAFVAMGVPEDQARHYESEFQAGRTILTVKTDDRQQAGDDCLLTRGASAGRSR